MDCSPAGLCPWDSPGKNTGVSSHFLLQGIFLTQGLNLGLLYCRQILDCLSQETPPRGGSSESFTTDWFIRYKVPNHMKALSTLGEKWVEFSDLIILSFVNQSVGVEGEHI